MLFLRKMLAAWLEAELITEDQIRSIEEFESQRRRSSWVVYGFVTLGVVVLCTGLISLIAYHWDEISDFTKLGLDAVLLLAGSWFCYWAHDRPMLYESALLFQMLLILGSIGLISQVFHTGGTLPNAILLWCGLCVGFMWVSDSIFTPLIWCGALTWTLAFIVVDDPYVRHLFPSLNPYWFVFFPIPPALLWAVTRCLSGACWRTTAFSWVASVAAGVSLAFLEPNHSNLTRYLPYVFTDWLLVYGLAAPVAGFTLCAKSISLKQKGLLLVIGTTFLLLFHLPHWVDHWEWLKACQSIGFLTLVTITAASFGERWLFQLGLVAIGCRFFLLYLQALGGLFFTGLGLVGAGLLIILLAWLWGRFRDRIFQLGVSHEEA